MSQNEFAYTHRVTYADCTAGNHVYYGRYLELLEAARGEFFRVCGTSFIHWQERNTTFPVIACRLQYHLPARYDDTLAIAVDVTLAKGARLNLGYRITDQHGRAVLTAETWHACADLAGKPKRLPADLLNALTGTTNGTNAQSLWA